MSSRQQQLPAIDRRQFTELVRESQAVISLVNHDHDFWSYPPAMFACCYAIIRIGEGANRLDSRSKRRLRSAALGIWMDARNALAHDLGMMAALPVHHLLTNELPLLLSDLERLGQER